MKIVQYLVKIWTRVSGTFFYLWCASGQIKQIECIYKLIRKFVLILSDFCGFISAYTNIR